MQNNINDSIEENMHGLRVQYLERLKPRIKEFEKFLITAESGSLTQKDIDDIKFQAHKLAGTGTTYGYPEISEAGMNLEDLLIASPHGNAKTTILLRTLLNACIEAQTSKEGDI
jgi:HPt (histidine-containing phosphotransfer) domain-containing protein